MGWKNAIPLDLIGVLMRILSLLVALFVALPAWAGTIAVVDFQRAVTDTTEGQQAQKTLDTMFASKKLELERAGATLEKEIADFQARAAILAPDARVDEERKLAQKQGEYQQNLMVAQQEMQQTYMKLLQDLDTKMRAMSEKLAKEKGYDLVLDRAVVVYMSSNTVDMTEDLVTRYNAEVK